MKRNLPFMSCMFEKKKNSLHTYIYISGGISNSIGRLKVIEYSSIIADLVESSVLKEFSQT